MPMVKRYGFGRNFLAPQLVVLTTTLVALFAVFGVMVAKQNDANLLREQGLLARGVEDRISFVQNNLRDYSRWDDAVKNLAVHMDTGWANDNIGPYLANTQGYDSTMVVTPDGRTDYSSEGTRESGKSAQQLLEGGFAPFLSRLNAVPGGTERRLVTVMMIHGEPTIVAGAQILPTIGSTLGHPFPRRYLLITEQIDSEVLAPLARSLQLQDLQLHLGPPDVAASVPIRDWRGTAIAHLQWQPGTPGWQTAFQVFPWLAAIAFGAVLLSIRMLKRAQFATRKLASNAAKARHLAHHDTLTGLPNRRSLLAHGSRTGRDRPVAMLYLDLDGFKDVNDLFGHQAGDVLLREATARLRQVVDDRGLLVRMGGDEFAVLLTEEERVGEAEPLAQRIVAAMARPFCANGINIVVSASVGIALRRNAESIEDLARQADIAMYAAKADGKSRVRIYGPTMSEGRELRKRLESELREALERGEVEVAFQPIVRAGDGEVVCYEALARWTSPTQGPIGPAIFVSIAEESGLIVKLGEAVLHSACRQARDWGVDIAVNLSPAQFWHENLAEDILAILRDTGFPPERLELEITEGYLLSRPELAERVVEDLRAHGIRIALDDFGTGFASIGYLRRFNLDTIKLDKSLTEHVERDSEAAEVAQAVIALSHSLKLPITAEGIENEAQAVLLQVAGCERLQGWHFGHPVLGEEVEAASRASRAA